MTTNVHSQVYGLDTYLPDVVSRLAPSDGPKESPSHYLLACPNCHGDWFFLSKANGSGFCHDEPFATVKGVRRYSPWEIADLLAMDTSRLYGLFTGHDSVNLPAAASATEDTSLRGLRPNGSETELAQTLLQDPYLLERLQRLAENHGIVGTCVPFYGKR